MQHSVQYVSEQLFTQLDTVGFVFAWMTSFLIILTISHETAKADLDLSAGLTLHIHRLFGLCTYE